MNRIVSPGRIIKIILTLLLVTPNLTITGQTTSFSYFYRVYFRDKGSENPGNYALSDLLSERAVNRRLRSGILNPDYTDLPVFDQYLSGIKSLGFTLHCTSKWLNTAVFKTSSAADLSYLAALPYVTDIKIVKRPAIKAAQSDKLAFKLEQSVSPAFDKQLTMLNGDRIQNSGFTGEGVLIAVLDGGFANTDKISSLNNLRSRGGIKYTYDFVKKNTFVYDYHSHGTAVLSVLAGQLSGLIQGSAPGADFILLRTEDTYSEYSVEEDFWAAGAEFADSAGADIISSSLGYYQFDDASTSYKFSDMDGNTTFVTRAADIAAAKGILVVTSAGNERDKTWIRIIAPTDGDNVLSAGAVDEYGLISSFSSSGPSADGRIKPDNVALGVSVTVQTSVSEVGRSNGTSFSCPVLSGMSACLKQAVPEATNTEIISVLHSSADRYSKPDSLYGFGIPDMVKALTALQQVHLMIPEKTFEVHPNPTRDEFEIVFKDDPGDITLEIFSSSGKNVLRRIYKRFAGRSLTISDLANGIQGLYLIRISTDNGIYTRKIIKLGE